MQRSKGATQGRGVKMKPARPAVKQPLEKGTTDKPLAGRVFYLDITSKLVSEKLEKDIKDLGGTVEGFLSKEIKYLITNKKEAKCTKSLKYSCSLSSPEPAANAGSSSAQPGSRRGGIQEAGSSKKPEKNDVSRGKSLLKKVIKQQEILSKNSILANAWNWGVRILHVDEAKIYIEQKKRLLQQGKQPEAASKPVVKQPVRRKPRAQKLKSPYIKVEDRSCLNKTWHGQDGGNNSHCIMREKKRGYCECCLQKYDDLEAHVVSPQHKNYSQGPNYQDVDNLISMFDFDFVDWSVCRQEAKSSVLMPTVTVDWHEKEIAEKYQQVYEKIPSSGRLTPETVQRTEFEDPLAAADNCLVNNIQSPEPMDSVFCPVQIVENHACASDSFDIPPGTPAFLPYSEKSLTHVGDTVAVCDGNTHRPVHTSQELTLGISATPIQECSPEPVYEYPSKKMKLDGSLVSETLYCEPLDANHVTKPVMDSVPKGLETACLLNRSDGLHDQSLQSSPSQLHRKVKRLERKARKQVDLSAMPVEGLSAMPVEGLSAMPVEGLSAMPVEGLSAMPVEGLSAMPVRKVSVPVEDHESGSYRERLLSLFETSEVQSEFCGFSCKSGSLPHGTDVKEGHPSSKDDFIWCCFSTTSSSVETFYGF
ncbi:protein DBF4 homolog A isoform X2 [Rana temporaria]|uniref:protein DBF4 homolog A isoform X2 n=1 Tax=Rana temporaria TaxID=8407 RepID=UPI001AACB592|nr:protein DBF4 homolog A isoform X2 [Rana temporaria]